MIDSLDNSAILTEHSSRMPHQTKGPINTTLKLATNKVQLSLEGVSFGMQDANKPEITPSNKNSTLNKASKLGQTGALSLNYSNRDLNAFPAAILEHRTTLLILDLSRNKLVDFPKEIFQLRQLHTLKIESNYLKKIPAEISQLQSLETLSLAHNYILSIPKSLSNLSKTLTYLNISYNHLEELPKELGHLKNLKALNIQSNSFTSLPITIENFSNLQEISLDWFKYCVPSMQMVQNDKSRYAILKLSNLCRKLNACNRSEITFEDFMIHFSAPNDNLLETKDHLQRNFLHIATLEEDIGVVRFLLSNKESLLNELDHDKQTPLSLAVREEKYFVAKLLLLHGADPKKGGGTFGSALHMAVTKQKVPLARELLKHGANPNSLDFENNTPLHLLCSIYSKDSKASSHIMQSLFEHGANPNLVNADFWTPLHLAVRRGQVDCVKWIIKHNAKMKDSSKEEKMFMINQKGGSDHWTALHLACSLGFYEIMNILIENGADVMERTRTGKSPREVAANNYVVNKMMKRFEYHWISQNIFRPTNTIESAMRDINSASSNVNNLKSLIHMNSTNMQTLMTQEDDDPTPIGSNKSPLKAKFYVPLNPGPRMKNSKKTRGREENAHEESSLMIADVDETIIHHEAIPSMPRSPNNIQKIQIAQSYRNHFLGGQTDNLPSARNCSSRGRVNSSKMIAGWATSKAATSNTKFLFPTDVNNYLKNFDNYHDEIKAFRKNILDEFEMGVSEKIKHLLFLKAIHMKFNQTLKRISSDLLPVELFMICEFIDDEYRKHQFVSKNTGVTQNADLIPRTLLFIFENLEGKNGSANSVLKSMITQFFGEFGYQPAQHFLTQFLHSNHKTIGRISRREVNSAIKLIDINKTKSSNMLLRPQMPLMSTRISLNMDSLSENLKQSAVHTMSVSWTKKPKPCFQENENCENVEEEEAEDHLKNLNLMQKKPLNTISKLSAPRHHENNQKENIQKENIAYGNNTVKHHKHMNSDVGDTLTKLQVKESRKYLGVSNYFTQQN